MSVGGEAKPLSYDHKPTNAAETSRIVAAGGFVEFGRVNGQFSFQVSTLGAGEHRLTRLALLWSGNLALSRALGDFEFKQSPSLPAEQQVVTADPDINSHSHTDEDEFIVVACDGIWDVLTSQQVIDYVRLSIARGQTLEQICESMMDRCLAPDSDWGGVGCDNMTMMVVAILGDRTQDEWYEWIKQRVDQSEPYNTPKEFVEPFAQGGNGPRGALMAGGSNAAGGGGGGQQGGVVIGRAGPGGGVQGLNLSAFAGGNGVGEDDSDDEGEELDLPTIQAALRARMAEFEREEQDQAREGEEGASIEQVEDVDEAKKADGDHEDEDMADSTKPEASS